MATPRAAWALSPPSRQGLISRAQSGLAEGEDPQDTRTHRGRFPSCEPGNRDRHSTSIRPSGFTSQLCPGCCWKGIPPVLCPL